jgi:hypothetical protein
MTSAIEMTSAEAREALLAGTAPDHLSVSGWLDLRGCTGLTSLPDHLSVRGGLDLSGCTGLTSLPDHLSVRGSLYLFGCPGLAHYKIGTDIRGYDFYAIPMADGLHIVAGCRNLRIEKAKRHWARNPECLAFVMEAARDE